MFFRLKQSPSGRVLQLLESYRNPEGQPRHRVVISLGDAALAHADWKTVAGAVSAELYGQKPMLPPELSTNAQKWIDSITRRENGVRLAPDGARCPLGRIPSTYQ